MMKRYITLRVATRNTGARRAVGGVIYSNEPKVVRVAAGGSTHKALLADSRLTVEEHRAGSAKSSTKNAAPAAQRSGKPGDRADA